MDYSLGINNKTLKRNVGDVLKQYDQDGNGFNKAELKDLIKGSVSIFGKPFIKDKAIQNVQKQFDTNNDGIISEKEIDSFLKKQYDLKLDDAKKMKVKDLVDTIQEKDEARKKAKKK